MWSEATRAGRDNSSLGRLKPGVSFEQARTELATLAARLAEEHPMDRGIGTAIESLADTRSGPAAPILWMLSGAVGMVLVIACANLASLLLARNSSRSHEMAIRALIGAGRSTLLRLLFVEALVLSVAGSLAGLGLASATSFALTRMNGSGILPYTATTNVLGQFSSAAPEPRILLFALGISLITAVLFGLAPAFTGARVSLADTLRDEAEVAPLAWQVAFSTHAGNRGDSALLGFGIRSGSSGANHGSPSAAGSRISSRSLADRACLYSPRALSRFGRDYQVL